MANYDTLGMIKQRLEILYQWVESLESGGGGGSEDSYTKEESDARYVRKETGKGLSTNDFTNAYKNKIDNNATAIDDLEDWIVALFTPDNVNVVESGTIGADALALAQLHEPLMLNGNMYHFLSGSTTIADYFSIERNNVAGTVAFYFARIDLTNGQLTVLDVVMSSDQPVENGDDLFTTGGAYNLQVALEDLIADKQDELTFDTAPTNGSTNPCTSGGIYSANVLTNNAINQLGDTVVPNIADPSKVFVSSTAEELTFTITGDVYSITGTATGSTTRFQNIYYFGPNTIAIPPGGWTAQIYPQNENVRLVYMENGSAKATGNWGVALTFNAADNISTNWLRWQVKGGTKLTTDNNFTLRIAPRYLYVKASGYRPYKMTYDELVAAVKALQAAQNGG